LRRESVIPFLLDAQLLGDQRWHRWVSFAMQQRTAPEEGHGKRIAARPAGSGQSHGNCWRGRPDVIGGFPARTPDWRSRAHPVLIFL
jgi:hypothetical protein